MNNKTRYMIAIGACYATVIALLAISANPVGAVGISALAGVHLYYIGKEE